MPNITVASLVEVHTGLIGTPKSTILTRVGRRWHKRKPPSDKGMVPNMLNLRPFCFVNVLLDYRCFFL